MSGAEVGQTPVSTQDVLPYIGELPTTLNTFDKILPSRRIVLKGMFAAAIAAKVIGPERAVADALGVVARLADVATDGLLGDAEQIADAETEHVWPHTGPAELLRYTSEKVPENPSTTWFVFPGRGHQHGAGIASSLSDAIDGVQPIYYFEYGNEALIVDRVASELKKVLRDCTTNTVSILGHSMGTVAAFEALSQIAYEDDAKVTLKPIANIALLSSPLTLETARFGELARILIEANVGRGALGKYAQTAIAELALHHHNLSEIGSDITGAWANSMHGASWALISSQDLMLKDADSLEARMKILEPYMPKGMRATYMAPQITASDEVVDVHKAYGAWHHCFRKNFDVSLNWCNNGTGHASYSDWSSLDPVKRFFLGTNNPLPNPVQPI